ncbi:MAG TPA: PIN domain-containing protein [Polyangia bacterium]|nr:PIN domain-containing protein [Polyangia bacterium]
MLVVVDTGPLYAVVDEDDADHGRCRAVLEDPRYRLVVPALVVAEATDLVGRRLGATIEAQFLRGMESMDIEAPAPNDWRRIAELVERYADFPLGGADASVVALAERLGATGIATLDVRHFGAVRPRRGKAFHLLPS